MVMKVKDAQPYAAYFHVGKRIWDIELMALELDNINRAGLIDQHDYLIAKMILSREHRIEVKNEQKKALKDPKNDSQ